MRKALARTDGHMLIAPMFCEGPPSIASAPPHFQQSAKDWKRIAAQASQCAKDGRIFDLGLIAPSNEAIDLAFDLVNDDDSQLRAPYREFAVVAKIRLPTLDADIAPDDDVDLNTLLVLQSDDSGRLIKMAAAVMMNEMDESHYTWRLISVILFDPERPGQLAGAATYPTLTDAERRAAASYYHLCNYVLMLLADDRIPAKLVEAPEKLQKARLRRRKPPLPSYWSVCAAAADPLYSTHISTHGAAPKRPAIIAPSGRHVTPHTRRGHWRQLPSGKKTWVRDARINDLAKHMTRQRSHYALRNTPAEREA
jgi:hypothetical protein